MKKQEYQTPWDKIWDVISPEISKYQFQYGDLYLSETCKDDIFATFNELVNYIKVHYMDFNEDEAKKEDSHEIDRHKTSAALMIAIVQNQPLKMVSEKYYDGSKIWLFNEQIAITAGLSLMIAFEKEQIKKHPSLDQEQKKELLLEWDKGIIFPIARHGDYRENWAVELYYTAKEGNYNLLATAHELFHLEERTKERIQQKICSY